MTTDQPYYRVVRWIQGFGPLDIRLGGGELTYAEHPATYSDELMPHFQSIIDLWWAANDARKPLVFDPFAGTGRIHELQNCLTVGNELEPEWAGMHPLTRQGDALHLSSAYSDVFDIVITSPTYGNRMADSHTPGPDDKSKRITYTHRLGRKLTEGSSGSMQWNAAYREFHVAAWTEVRRVLMGGGWFVLNIRDHIRAGGREPVSEWHFEVLKQLGFIPEDEIRVETPGMKYGANADKRVGYETIYRFRLPLTKENLS